MTIFIPARRTTLLLPSGPADDPDRPHLFIVLNDPVEPSYDTLLVNIASIYPNRPYDPTCLLYVGDHPFIERQSYVCYRYARIEPAQNLINGALKKIFSPHEMIDEAIFARVCKGLLESRFTPLKAKRFLQQMAGPQL